MFKKATIIKGLILLVVVGIIGGIGWAAQQIREKRATKTQTEIQKELKGETKIVEEGTKTSPEEGVKELSPVKENPPYEVGDVIGYSDPGLPERYVGKVVVATDWGNVYVADENWNLTLEKEEKETKQIGYIIRGKGTQYEYRIGPKGIAVDRKKNIYLNDPVDKEIYKYNSEGTCFQVMKHNFAWRPSITVDLVTDELYLYETGDLRFKNIFNLFNHEGKLVKTYRIPENKDLEGGGLYIYNGFIWKDYKEKPILKIDPTKIEKEEKDLPILIPTFSESNEILLPSKITPKGEKKEIKKIPVKLPEEYSGYQSLRFFITNKAIFGYYAFPMHPWRYIMAKFNKDNGELLAIIDLKDQQEQYTEDIDGVTIDDSENIYELYTTKSGVYVIRWTKVEE